LTNLAATAPVMLLMSRAGLYSTMFAPMIGASVQDGRRM